MKRSIRPSTPADARAIVGLFTQAGLQPNADPPALHWKYWQERADSTGPRSYVLTSGADVIAHGAFVPGRLAWGARRETTGHVIDWVARPGEFGAGTMIMKHIGQQVDSLLAIGGSADTLRILPHIGFQDIGLATSYVRPLFPLRRLHGGENRDWKTLPRIVRSLVWKAAAPRAVGAGWGTRPVADDAELEQLAAVLPTATANLTVLERSVGLFRYMLRCPIVPMQLYALERAAQLRGYFLLASAPGQVRIVDCWVNSADPSDWRSMLLCAVAQAKQDAQASELVICASDPLLTTVLPRCGFHRRGETPIRLRPARETPMPASLLRIQMLDNDAAFFHEGRNEFWA
jgi:hypothetical protein